MATWLSFALLVTVTTVSLADAPATAAKPAEPAADLSLSSDLYRTDERGALARLALATSRASHKVRPAFLNTWADIQCPGIYPAWRVLDKAFGLDYPTNYQLRIYHDLFINGGWWLTVEGYPWTTASGSWSTSTGEHWTLIEGQYKLVVVVQGYNSHVTLDTAMDTCEH